VILEGWPQAGVVFSSPSEGWPQAGVVFSSPSEGWFIPHIPQSNNPQTHSLHSAGVALYQLPVSGKPSIPAKLNNRSIPERDKDSAKGIAL